MAVMIDIADQRLDRAIPALRILVHRGEAEHVEIGRRGLATGPGGSLSPEGGHPPCGDRWPLRLSFGDDRFDFTGSLVGQVERQSPHKQLVQHHAEAVDIGVDADPPGSDLFRSGVGGRHEPQTGPGLLDRCFEAFQLLGDTEVEQLHRAVGGDEDVGGLEIAMYYQMAMGVLNRLAHGAEQLEPLSNARSVRGTIVGERDTLDVLHDEPWRSVREGIRVVQAGDGGVIQVGQGTLLAGEPLATGRGEPGITQQLHRGQGTQILPFGEVDDSHPSLAQHLKNPVRAEPLGGKHRRIVQHLVRDSAQIPIEQRAAAGRPPRGGHAPQRRSAASSPHSRFRKASRPAASSSAAAWKSSCTRPHRA